MNLSNFMLSEKSDTKDHVIWFQLMKCLRKETYRKRKGVLEVWIDCKQLERFGGEG